MSWFCGTTRQSAVGMALATLLAGCGDSTPQPDMPFRQMVNTAPWETGESSMAGSSGSLFNLGGPKTAAAGTASSEAQGLGVNAFLWRGALDTLSFMPLASADPFGGVIITDWYAPPAAPGERFKANAYILGRQLRADGLKVSIFRQVEQGGTWVDAAVAPGTTAEIENKILAKARELRAQAPSGH